MIENAVSMEVKTLDLPNLPAGSISKLNLELVTDALGVPLAIPIIIAKGMHEGPIIGICAAIHGNELNGILVIQDLFKEINPCLLHGIIIGIPVVNIFGYLMNQREFIDGKDLNTIMPGKKEGNQSEVFVYRFLHKIIHQCQYMIDLHTASFGRINSHYIRADLSNNLVSKLAGLQLGDIILNSVPSPYTLRGVCASWGIPAITIEIGSPQRFQMHKIRNTYDSIVNILIELKMIEGEMTSPEKIPIVCRRSYWLRTKIGGVLLVFPELADEVKKGEKIAELRDIFGELQKEYFSPEDGVVIGKSNNPVALSGSRILHLGLLESLETVKDIIPWDWEEDDDMDD